MKHIEIKLQEFRKKIRRIWLVTKYKAKVWFVKFEHRLGFATRCSLCEENIFCETYQGKTMRRTFFHVARCTEHQSAR